MYYFVLHNVWLVALGPSLFLEFDKYVSTFDGMIQIYFLTSFEKKYPNLIRSKQRMFCFSFPYKESLRSLTSKMATTYPPTQVIFLNANNFCLEHFYNIL